MLRITQQAASVLSQIRAGAGAPDNYGVRFFAQSTPEGGAQVGLDFVERPAEGDQVSKQENMPVYVAADVAEPLSEAVVDARPTDGAPQLVIEPRGQSTEPPAS